MKYQENFKFLKADLMKRKKTEENKTESEFMVLHLLDNENNPCRFFVFNKETIEKVKNYGFVGLQDVIISFELIFNNNWNVKLIDIA